MDYKKEIIDLLDQISEQKYLKYIYDLLKTILEEDR